MHNIRERYDVAIVDIPYGLYSPITSQEQKDMDNIITSAGFKVLDKCYMIKGNMKREISICE